MKFLILFFIGLYIQPVFAQLRADHSLLNNQYRLVAENGRRVRKYANRQPLKIEYRNNDEIRKAKGRLLFFNGDEIQLLPYGRKDIVNIKINSIISIQRWNRPGKIGVAILGGTGLAALGLAFLSYNPNNSTTIADGSIITLILVLYAVVDLYYIGVAIPVIFISEWLSIRSEKKGYHFYIEERRPVRN